MKRLLTIMMALTIILTTNAQEISRKIAVGIQTSLPVYGLSVKYAFTDHSVGQATIAPFGIKSDGGSASINFYGLRYIYRFPGNEDHAVIVDPYVFIGTGLINFKYDYSSYGGNKSSQNIFSYSGGGGIEVFLFNKVGLSAEIGYGKISVSAGTGISTLLGGGGIHYYIF